MSARNFNALRDTGRTALSRTAQTGAATGGEGTREQFEASFPNQTCLPRFIRGLVGLDREAVQKAFGEFLAEGSYNANQIHFIHRVIDELSRNGVMEASRLFEQPFTELHTEGVAGLFPHETDRILGILAAINRNAESPSAGDRPRAL